MVEGERCDMRSGIFSCFWEVGGSFITCFEKKLFILKPFSKQLLFYLAAI